MRFAADENFNGRILAGLRQRFEILDIVRIQDTACYGLPDPAMLEWAAQERRIVLTHDVQTRVNDAYERIRGSSEVHSADLRFQLGLGTALSSKYALLTRSRLSDVRF